MASTLPRYAYDPVTQTFKLMTPEEEAQAKRKQGLGALQNNDGGGSEAMGPTGPGPSMTDPGMAEMGVGMQNMAMDLANYASMPIAPGAMIAGLVSQGLMGITTSPSMMGMATPSPVAPPTSPVVTPIAPTQTANLQAMNQSDGSNSDEDDGPEGVVTVGQLSMVSPEAIAEAASVANAQAEAANAQAAATAASDSGPATATGAGEASDASVSGANSEASHAADGNNSGGDGTSGGCFLTTAAVKHMGQKDDGEVLSTLRNFRDTYMRKDKNKSKDVEWYYKNAPKIMRELDKREDADVVYKRMYRNYIEPAYKAIKNGNKREAYDIYRQLVNYAKDKSGIESKKLTPKPKHYACGGVVALAGGGDIMNYENNGIATAQQTQGMGRGSDTMLVHMSPREVQGLQALAMAHGGSLTINPKTGLPEAGFLDSILPMVAGAALTGISGGLINPMTAGLLVGGGTALFTGDLGKGFMAGLGAFGGAGIGAGLAGAGATTTAGQVMTPTVANATQVAAQPVASTAMSSVAPESFKGVLMANGTLAPQAVTPAINQAIANQATQTAVQQAAAAPTLSGMSQGVQNLVTGAPGAGSNFMTAVGGPMNLAKYGGAAASPMLGGMLEPEQGDLKKQQTYIRPYKYDAGRQTDKEGFQYRTGAPGEPTSELTYFSPGFTPQGVYKYEDYMAKNMAGGGIASMAKGRYLKGAGDGMSDDIPATIEGGQPARLADGEFVVPADVVSHLGNGSSNAGAKKLYKMMDRIRTARTGKKGQAPEVKTEKYMPA